MMKQMLGAVVLAIAMPHAVSAAVIFFEDFSDNSAGWTLGQNWEIGPATTSSGHSVGNPDPAFDHTPTDDNGIAGVVIGGNAPTLALHDFYYLVSPVIDASSIVGTLSFEFYRWLNSDYTPFMQNRVDVYDGLNWVNVFLTGGPPAVLDSSWTRQLFDITAYANSALQVRFGYNIGSTGVWTMSGWNIDDVKIFDDATAVPAPGTLALLGVGLVAMGFYRRRQITRR